MPNFTILYKKDNSWINALPGTHIYRFLYLCREFMDEIQNPVFSTLIIPKKGYIFRLYEFNNKENTLAIYSMFENYSLIKANTYAQQTVEYHPYGKCIQLIDFGNNLLPIVQIPLWPDSRQFDLTKVREMQVFDDTLTLIRTVKLEDTYMLSLDTSQRLSRLEDIVTNLIEMVNTIQEQKESIDKNTNISFTGLENSIDILKNKLLK
jgi:hypothetical protein